MNPARRKLIEELIRVGRLIDPATNRDHTEHEENTKQSDPFLGQFDQEFEGIPVMEKVVDSSFSTKDMFSSDDILESNSGAYSNGSEVVDSGSEDIALGTSKGDSIYDSEKESVQSVPPEQFPITELARELVVLIEERVSKRSGEYLDDAFRDELTEAVTSQLESWLHYD